MRGDVPPRVPHALLKGQPMTTRCSKWAATIAVFAAVSASNCDTARADIFQWEYNNPNDPAQGTNASLNLCTDGAGVIALPHAYLSGRNLRMAYLVAVDLSWSSLDSTDLADADLSYAQLAGSSSNFTKFDNANFAQADLSGGYFYGASFVGANLAGAVVHNANFDRDPNIAGVGVTSAQLYTTSSYQSRDLSLISLGGNSLPGINLGGQNLTSAGFYQADLTGEASSKPIY